MPEIIHANRGWIMRRAVLVCLFLAPFIFSCASAPVEPVKYGYEKDAIELHLKADKQLNYKDKKAHALVICVYQLMSPNAFNQLAGSRATPAASAASAGAGRLTPTRTGRRSDAHHHRRRPRRAHRRRGRPRRARLLPGDARPGAAGPQRVLPPHEEVSPAAPWQGSSASP